MNNYPKQLRGERAKEVYDDTVKRYSDADETIVINYANSVEKMEDLQSTIFNKPYYNKSGVATANPNVKSLQVYTQICLQLAKVIGIGKLAKAASKKPTLLAFNKGASSG